MPLISDYNQVRDVYQEARELGVGLPLFCAEDRETLEAILCSALEMGRRIGVPDLPIIPAWTSRYPGRSQMKLVTACGEPLVGIRMMFSDLDAFMDESSPYRNLRVMPHLDHAFPWLDGDVLDRYADRFASVMCDASEKPFEENIRLTAQYVEKSAGQVVVEGAVDEIFEAGSGGTKNEPTTVEQAARFVRETGVDLIVPNVGTEHRAAAHQVDYNSSRAREISAALGKVLCIHGTSSVKPQDLPRLPDDGFIKINIFTTLAVHGGQAVARQVLGSLPDVLSGQELRELLRQGVIGEAALRNQPDAGSPAPKLSAAANPPRRDAWLAAVRDECMRFLEVFGYDRFVG